MPAPSELENQEENQNPETTEVDIGIDSESQYTNSDEGSEEGITPEPEERLSRDDILQMRQITQNAVQQNRVLQQQIANLQSSLAPRPEAPAPVTDEDFQTSPAEAMRRLIDERISQSISPIAQDFAVQKKERAFVQQLDSALDNVRPGLSEYRDALAPRIRQVIGDADPTPQAIHMATLMVIGDMALKGQTAGNPPSNNTANPPVASRGSNVPASAPNRAPAPSGKKVTLTESQKRTMKNLGFAVGEEKEFMNFLNADEVTFDTPRGNK